jgi:hypothetical protein
MKEFCHSETVLPSTRNKVSAHNSCKNGFLVIFFLNLPVEITLQLPSGLCEKKVVLTKEN